MGAVGVMDEVVDWAIAATDDFDESVGVRVVGEQYVVVAVRRGKQEAGEVAMAVGQLHAERGE